MEEGKRRREENGREKSERKLVLYLTLKQQSKIWVCVCVRVCVRVCVCACVR